MKTAIVYYSHHHGNTKKLLDAIAQKNEVDLLDVNDAKKMDLTIYDRIGLASGIYYSSFAKQMIDFVQTSLPEGKDVFYIATCGASPTNLFLNAIKRVVREKNSKEIGEYICCGFDTFGPFKLIGGIKKGHPTDEEIQGAVIFYEGLKK